jgi:hypothetical protein
MQSAGSVMVSSMAKPTQDDLHLERHQKMLEFQKAIEFKCGAPFPPTIKELNELWTVDNSGTSNSLRILMAMHLVVKRHGHYMAIDGR